MCRESLVGVRGTGAADEWTLEGGPKGRLSRDRRASHPLSIGAHMDVCVGERATNVNLSGIAGVMASVSCV